MPTHIDGRPLSRMHHREWFYADQPDGGDGVDGGGGGGGGVGFTYEAWNWCGDPQADEVCILFLFIFFFFFFFFAS